MQRGKGQSRGIHNQDMLYLAEQERDDGIADRYLSGERQRILLERAQRTENITNEIRTKG